ncbi:carboxylate--amine ligase/circularly permuted type 2 ATP-grasp protein [uncultured Dietzia sp.]|uniref:carboxylate--amine ligase/circularly permuted type 2 ATP-grasp protein n=1 Tax=uncultured Dietzia sp. TaxID=395519 RepID=UPI0025FD43C8|nr:carboxylate--amine ligase/circularly permuted type 2 ATP-grasp protein [uncultured Dietzia sp.]
MTDGSRRIMVEEELHLVDLRTKLPARRAAEVIAEAGDDRVRAARHGALVASDCGGHATLEDLGEAIRERRTQLAEVANGLRTGIVAAGALGSPGVELAPDPDEPGTAPGHEFRTRASARFVVTVEVADADEAQFVARRVVPHAPALLALAAGSPFRADGSDSGYASVRSFEARWSPAHVSAFRTDTADGVLESEDALVATGVVADRGLIDADIRPSADGSGVELRLCDSCSTVDTIVLVAALFRALVDRVLADPENAWVDPTPAVLAAAFWRAARSGLEGDLVDPGTGQPLPAGDVCVALVESLSGQLDATGERGLVDDLVDGVLGAGSSAARQRAAHRRRGRRADVVAVLLAETVGRIRPRATADDGGMRSMLDAYSPLGEAVTEEVHDEAITEDGAPRPQYVDVLKAVSDLGAATVRERKKQVDEELRDRGVTLKVYGEPEPQVFPLDPVPRIVPADQWGRISAGIEQRGRALEMFLRDIYGDGEIVSAGIVPQDALDRAPGYRKTGRAVPAGTMRAAVSGVDLVSTGSGEWVVLEDNLRMPGGLAMAVTLRERILEAYPEFGARGEIHDPAEGLGMLRETLQAAAPEGVGDPSVAVVVAPDELIAHDLIHAAEAVGGAVVTPRDLVGDDGRLWRVDDDNDDERIGVDVLYVRMDEEALLSSSGADGTVLRRGLLGAISDGTVAMVNAPGNGAADDKAIYALVPSIIDFYLGEKPLIGQVDTFLCADPPQLEQVLDRLDELVVKPIDGYGGSDITVGPECSPRELDERRAELRRHGERFVAQEVQALSTLPTFDGRDLQRRHVDMRAFVMLRNGPTGEIHASAPPVAMTRVAPAGTMVVNASSGGGGKDTWIHRA